MVVGLGLATSGTVSLLVDPFGVFGTGGLVPSDVVNDREVKPKLFLKTNPSPLAIILGSSAVGKIKPACVTELTGLPTFNFGVPSGNVDDWDAILKFISDRGHAPIRELLIGLEVDAFDNHSSHQLELSRYLRDYTSNPGLSWAEVTRGLFGEQAFLHSLYLIWTSLRPVGEPDYIAPDGFRVEPQREKSLQNGTYRVEKARATTYQLQKFKRRASDRFDQLNPMRVKLFQDILRTARAKAITVDVFVPPMSQAMATARSFSQIPQRTTELERLLEQLERAGLLRYHRYEEFQDLAIDPDAIFDGVHLTEATSSRVLLRVFHREHGCGL